MEFQNKIIINKRDNNQRRQAGNQPDELLSGITVGSAFDNKKTKNCRNKYKEQKPPVVFFLSCNLKNEIYLRISSLTNHLIYFSERNTCDQNHRSVVSYRCLILENIDFHMVCIHFHIF